MLRMRDAASNHSSKDTYASIVRALWSLQLAGKNIDRSTGTCLLWYECRQFIDEKTCDRQILRSIITDNSRRRLTVTLTSNAGEAHGF